MVRFKNRYLLLELIWKDKKLDESINESTILQAVRDSLHTNYGDLGLAEAVASLQVKYFSPYTNLCILRCDRDKHQQVWCAVTSITEMQLRKLLIRVIQVGGTLQTCQRQAMEYSEHVLLQLSMSSQVKTAAWQAAEHIKGLLA